MLNVTMIYKAFSALSTSFSSCILLLFSADCIIFYTSSMLRFGIMMK